MIVYDKKGNKHIVCKSSKTKKCEDCKAYVTRCIDYNSENGFDFDEWEECAFGYIKYESHLKYLEYLKNQKSFKIFRIFEKSELR